MKSRGLGVSSLGLLGIAVATVFVCFAQVSQAAEPKDKQGASRSAGKVDAAQNKKKATEGKNNSPKVEIKRGPGGRKVFRITTGFVIEGRIQKPNAFYVLQRSQINYDWAGLTKDFAPRILETVKKHPF